ncbi:hypothetical protein VTJ83DRAFT_5731 [Remersonia thermophila]|uniref:EF-hand domain-containing protein n=1 Tax=Remersonia thermophila TaxID=72144 RepID=A0ABR4D7N9_9PEZI
MPPRRRQPGAGASSSAAATPRSSARQSKLAKEHNITAEEEAEIREAFSLFAEPMEGEKDGVIPIGDVRRALIALGIPPSSPSQLSAFIEALDPHDEGFATYPAFVGVCALQINARRDRDGGPEYDDHHRAELDEAYGLFTTAAGSAEGPSAPRITLADLKRVAALLRLDQASKEEDGKGHRYQEGRNKKAGDLDGVVVTEEVLRDMILEANGGAGVGKGVTKEEFDRVMRRAGVWR